MVKWIVSVAKLDFSNIDSVSTWFEVQSAETRSLMASRAALRVVSNFRAGQKSGHLDDLDLSLFRSILTSAGRGLGRSTGIDWSKICLSAADDAAETAASPSIQGASKHAAESSADASYSAGNISLDTSAEAAARSVGYSTFTFRRSTGGAVKWDAEHLEILSQTPVWGLGKVPDAIMQNHKKVIIALRANPAWGFWLRFYNGMWNGTFTDWDLALEVIQIEQAVWEKGYVHVGAVIAGIEARMRTSVAPPLVRNELADAFVVDAKSPLPDELLDYIKERVGAH